MRDIKSTLEVFYETCQNNSYEVIEVNKKETLIKDGEEIISLELQYEADTKLNILFYKEEETSNSFVNKVMQMFANVINREDRITN